MPSTCINIGIYMNTNITFEIPKLMQFTLCIQIAKHGKCIKIMT